jgi:uncharacterized protein YdcH (DUF465 family)
MFSEYNEQVTQLKASDAHFLQIFERHDALDQQIKRLEHHEEHATSLEIEVLKKEKLALKDQVYAILRKTVLTK